WLSRRTPRARKLARKRRLNCTIGVIRSFRRRSSHGDLRMAAQSAPDIWSLSDLCTPWCVHVVATLRVADHIAAGVTGIADLAAASGADGDSLQRVLRHLVGKGVFEEAAPGQFALNESARLLLDPGARLGLDLDSFGGRMANGWTGLLQSVRT